jgi:hypothetical protein
MFGNTTCSSHGCELDSHENLLSFLACPFQLCRSWVKTPETGEPEHDLRATGSDGATAEGEAIRNHEVRGYTLPGWQRPRSEVSATGD